MWLEKLHGSVLIERVEMCKENVLLNVQGGFRDERGCVDKVFTPRIVCEKFLEKNK